MKTKYVVHGAHFYGGEVVEGPRVLRPRGGLVIVHRLDGRKLTIEAAALTLIEK